MTEEELLKKSAEKLRELRRTVANNISPEDLADQVLEEKKVKIGARTIRDMENPEAHNPSIRTMYTLLSLYGITLGDFYRFTADDPQSRNVAKFLEVMRNPDAAKIINSIFTVYGKKAG